jgi:para-nitrobenzyl esterase
MRPILVYLHGGEYSTGSGSDPLYDGIRLCQRGDVVVITLNHRLNVFGHLYLGCIGDDKFRCSGNAGLLDIVLALKWIKENANEFGGDPHNVTLFGQSGGGAKIACLMAMPEAHGLFHRAMTMSGQQITVAGPRAAANRTQAYLGELKLQTTDVKSLLNLPVGQIIQATKTHDPVLTGRSIYFGPVLDDVVLQQHPFYPEAPAVSRHIPMIIGNTHDETRFFYGKDNSLFSLTWEELPRRLSEAMYVDISVDKVIAAYRNHYPEHSASEVFFAASTAGRSWRGAIIEAELRAQQRAPAYVYQLNFPSPEDDGRWRACHTLDIPLVFNNLDKPGSRTGVGTEASKVSEMMCDALIHFARYGKPGHAGIPHWDPYLLSNRATMIFDVNARIENDPRSFERRLFAQVPYIQRGTY